MLKVIKQGSIAGNVVNEDIISICDNYVIFLDGASGLSKNIIPDSQSDANWYVHRFIEEFANIHHQQNYKYKRYEIKKTIAAVRKAYYQIVPKNKIKNIDVPSASGIVLFYDQDYIKGYYFGDVLTMVKSKGTKMKKHYDRHLTKLDEIVFNKAKAISDKENISFKEAIGRCNDIVISHRLLKNTTDGYYIFGLDEDAVQHINTFKYRLADVESLLIMSDGFYSYFDESNYQNLLPLIKQKDSKELLIDIKAEFERDAGFSKFKRFKLVDDISFLLLETK